MDKTEPQCGSEKGERPHDYDLVLHVLGLLLVLAASSLGAGFPVAAKKISWLKVHPRIFFACKHFGTGVLIATAFLLPTAFRSLEDPCLPDLFTKDYLPLPGVIIMISLFALFFIRIWLTPRTGGHLHGLPTDNAHVHTATRAIHRQRSDIEEIVSAGQFTDKPLDRKCLDSCSSTRAIYEDNETKTTLSTMPTWFVAFYKQYVRQHAELVDMLVKDDNRIFPGEVQKTRDAALKNSNIDEESAANLKVYRRMSTNISLLEGGILLHSLLVGITLSITKDGFIILLVAMIFHQVFEGLGLGSRIATVPYPDGSIKPWLLVFAFGVTAPAGQLIGILTRKLYDLNGAFDLILVGILNAISSGFVIYDALVDLLAHDFLSEDPNTLLSKNDEIAAFAWIMLGGVRSSLHIHWCGY
ncbi:hypothetical protein QQS21_011011 [Conoideocrella luteorostrata]|uniref:Zinc/iron permease n=1 Tax=Conoideocrella luteorostrata TaxID=1105319 RepID=A0AAJ0CDW3_9HYPO|nr:hypothetical protein QQS21_011011 [Conoideocrella luteorostrata]